MLTPFQVGHILVPAVVHVVGPQSDQPEWRGSVFEGIELLPRQGNGFGKQGRTAVHPFVVGLHEVPVEAANGLGVENHGTGGGLLQGRHVQLVSGHHMFQSPEGVGRGLLQQRGA